jgi:hypothetical protein
VNNNTKSVNILIALLVAVTRIGFEYNVPGLRVRSYCVL